MKDRILQALRDLRQYALGKGCVISLFYHEEDSYLMRFANSAISLNTNEHLIRIEITAQQERKRASYELITDLGKFDEIRQGIDIAAEMVKHAQPMDYQPTIPVFGETFVDESSFDPALAALSNEAKLEYFNQAVAGLETSEIKLSGIFSSGTNIIAQINSLSEHAQYFASTDAQVTIVLAHSALKWEVIAEQSAQKQAELDPSALQRELALLLDHYQHDEAVQLPIGKYDIVFGPSATASLILFMNYVGFNGGSMKRGFSFLNEEHVGKKVFSEKFTLTDDPSLLETYPFRRDFTGIPRQPFSLFRQGVFQGFTWFQDDADEFGAQPTGHTVNHKSLALSGGDEDTNTLAALIQRKRERDILYIPFLHYMNLVNPSKGILTGSSRFGALLLGKDGSVKVPYNVRLTQSLLDIFSEKVAWLSRGTVAYNTSHSYGARNPTAIIVPVFVQVNDLEISHSNKSY